MTVHLKLLTCLSLVDIWQNFCGYLRYPVKFQNSVGKKYLIYFYCYIPLNMYFLKLESCVQYDFCSAKGFSFCKVPRNLLYDQLYK